MRGMPGHAGLLCCLLAGPAAAGSEAAGLLAELRAGAPAAETLRAEAPTGTLRVACRGAFAFAIRTEPGRLTLTSGEATDAIPAGAERRLRLAPGRYDVVVDGCPGPALQVATDRTSALVLDRPDAWAFAAVIAAGRGDEDPPTRDPRDERDEASQAGYAERWGVVGPEVVEEHHGEAFAVHARWRDFVPAVARAPRCDAPTVVVTAASRAGTVAVVVAATNRACEVAPTVVVVATAPSCDRRVYARTCDPAGATRRSIAAHRFVYRAHR